MLIRHLVIALPLTACAVELDTDTTAEHAAELTCGSFCDPEALSEGRMLEQTFSYGGWAFPGSEPFDSSCANLGSDAEPQWDCVVSLVTTANPCGPVAVECFRSTCHVQPLDYCH